MSLHEISLITLIWVSIIAIITIGGFLVKLIFDLIKLAQSATHTSDTLRNELEPTLEELKKAADSINSIASGVNEQFSGLQGAIRKILSVTSGVKSKLHGMLDGIIKGFSMGFGIFKK